MLLSLECQSFRNTTCVLFFFKTIDTCIGLSSIEFVYEVGLAFYTGKYIA